MIVAETAKKNLFLASKTFSRKYEFQNMSCLSKITSKIECRCRDDKTDTCNDDSCKLRYFYCGQQLDILSNPYDLPNQFPNSECYVFKWMFVLVVRRVCGVGPRHWRHISPQYRGDVSATPHTLPTRLAIVSRLNFLNKRYYCSNSGMFRWNNSQ